MKVKGGVEQAACILVILSTQIKGMPVKSDVISERLQVSSSYLKKVMRKLVVHNLIQSVSGTNGGFTLARPIEEVSALELFEAIEGTDEFLQLDGVFERTFPESSFTGKGEEVFKKAFLSAQQSYREKLSEFSLEVMLKQITGIEQLERFDWNQADPQNGFTTNKEGVGDTK